MTTASVMAAGAEGAADSPLPLIIATVITAIVSATAATLLMRAQARRRLEHAHREHRAELAAHEATASEDRTRLQRQEAMSTHALEAERIARSKDVTALLGHLTHGMKWERASREIILREATRLGVDGVLATNIALLTADDAGSPFVTQIDHLLITRETIILIEAKHWRGVVFDDIDPASLHPALAPIAQAVGLPLPPVNHAPPSFAIQLRGDKETPLTVDRRSSPRLQARAQAGRLSRALETAHVGVPWIQTCVFYSHPDVRLFASQKEPARGRIRTPAVDAASLGSFLRMAIHQPGKSPSDVPALVESLRPHAADLVGLGAMSDNWPDVFRSTAGTTRTDGATDGIADQS